ncbi:pentapeptide repeat-containing protein [Amycolatopsis sp. w19]|uniref:pentapeptide repeat-containing protein n=1 Tax=Amycolatopsis sp. w19 TaxID=3448134 RepID=UPI003F1A446C
MKARLDALKIGLSSGSGGVVALCLAWRRQHSTEADLGNRKRALAHQQDVAAATEAHKKRVADDASADRHELRREQVREREVRPTAQRLLKAHLTPRCNATYWSLFDLDLIGAQLINFDLSSARLGIVCFDEATFFGSATSFDRATFTGFDVFGDANFTGDAWFRRATFTNGVFDRATKVADPFILQKQAPALEALWPSPQGGLRKTMVFRTPAMRNAGVSSVSGGVKTLSRSPTSRASALLRQRSDSSCRGQPLQLASRFGLAS